MYERKRNVPADWTASLLALSFPPPPAARLSCASSSSGGVSPRLGCCRRDPELGRTDTQFIHTGITAGLRGCPGELYT
ncbi:hypothetical protein CesoFtcFv8_024394 [Champsocephalus esox]|uniref:Uncharacterized protein n=2 Tax=Champsocephalus TaxID=52236 RepID=A0AAN8CCH6_CHAGU|nr:hypothetical protein CesoFtcFv8_024394 [Champsocephalus esox]KAK5900992.1 hypothetical protein CgunFtcFv8_025905 [Champsocephalus gunnari]